MLCHTKSNNYIVSVWTSRDNVCDIYSTRFSIWGLNFWGKWIKVESMPQCHFFTWPTTTEWHDKYMADRTAVCKYQMQLSWHISAPLNMDGNPKLPLHRKQPIASKTQLQMIMFHSLFIASINYLNANWSEQSTLEQNICKIKTT